MPIDVEYIPNEDYVFRQISMFYFKEWENKRPNETDFLPDPDGLSVNWEKYCDLEQCFVLLGLTKNRNNPEKYIDPTTYKAIKLNVGVLRQIKTINDSNVDVIHNPLDGNDSHSLIIYTDEDDDVRLELCELVHKNYDEMVLKPDFKAVTKKLKELRT